VTHSGEGEGLLFYGNVILPFVDRFPTDTELYKIMTTKLSEVCETKAPEEPKKEEAAPESDKKENAALPKTAVIPNQTLGSPLQELEEVSERIARSETMKLGWTEEQKEEALSQEAEAPAAAVSQDPVADVILEWLKGYAGEYVCTKMICAECLQREGKPDRKSITQINQIMNEKAGGWTKAGRHYLKEYGTQNCWSREKKKDGKRKAARKGSKA
jgi:hypothetical protein